MPKQLIMKTMVGKIVTLDIVTILEEWRKWGHVYRHQEKGMKTNFWGPGMEQNKKRSKDSFGWSHHIQLFSSNTAMPF